MIKYIYIALLTFFVFELNAQNIKLLHNLSSLTTRADLLYEKSQYADAAVLYSKAYKKDTTSIDLTIKIGECHRLINEHQKAEYWYSKGIDQVQKEDSEIWMNYAQSLIINKKYTEAKKWLSLYNEHVDEDRRAVKKLNALNNLHFHFKDSSSVQISSLNINTEHVEFSPTYYNNGIVFLSDQHTSEINNVMNWSAEEYTNIYYTEEREDGTMKQPVEFHSGLSSNYHEGPLVFYDNNKIIFTRTGVQNTKTGEAHLELYGAEYDDKSDKWINVSPLHFNNKYYSVGHPAITKDGNKLIFSSNKPRGYGGTDLYVSHMVNGKWSREENLGESINTKGNEMFPYFPNADEIVFSSNGHGGLGDLDLFRVNLSISFDEAVENLGYPYNSPNADFGYISNESGGNGYFTSNRANGGLDDDIYRFVVKWSKIQGSIVERNNEKSIEQVKLEMIVSGKIKDTKYSDSIGIAEFITLPGEDVILKASKKGYLPSTTILSNDGFSAGKLSRFVMYMDKIPEPKVKKVPKDSYAQLMELYHKEKAMVQVNGRIFEYREIGNHQYLVNAEEQILLSKDPPDVDQPIADRAKKAIETKGLKMDGSYLIKNVYFDLNSISISDSAKIELDKVVKIMTIDQKIAFEINSFTDSRGSMSYNDELAFKRSQTVARYLMTKDVPGSRLIIESYGEQGLLNDCDDSNDCDELYHAVNRRAEFKLIMRKLYN